MKKVLLVSIGENFGGIEKLEVEYAKYITDGLKVDILASNSVSFKECEDELKKIQGSLYDLNIRKMTRKTEIIYDYRLYKFLKKNKYDIIHINSKMFFFSFRVVLIARLCGVKKIIVHSHGFNEVNGIRRFLINIFNPLYRNLVNEYLACSKLAEKSLFTESFINKNKVKVLKNGIDIDMYKFNEKTRNIYRKKLNIEKNVVYGHVGRFTNEKNHLYLIDLFYEIQKKQENSILLLIGKGDLKKQIQNKVNQLNINNKVIFLDFRDDVNNILNAVDIFIFPSLNEGLGMAVIESQTNGLITYCSNNVPNEVKISDRLKFFNLDESICDVATRICDENTSINSRKEAYKNTIESGYDIKKVCEELKNIYLKNTK